MNSYETKQALIAAGQWIGQKGWVPATGGNFSARFDRGIVVTGSGFDKGDLPEHAFLTFDEAGNVVAGEAKPSAETGLHLALYRMYSDCCCVLHTHSVAATVLSRHIKSEVLSITGYEMQKSLTGFVSHEQTVHIPIFDNDQDIARLAEKVIKTLPQYELVHGVLIRGHGLYAIGNSVNQTKQHLEGLEFLFACELERIKLENRL